MRARTTLSISFGVLVATAVVVNFARASLNGRGAPSLLAELSGPDELQREFALGEGHARLLLFLSPT